MGQAYSPKGDFGHLKCGTYALGTEKWLGSGHFGSNSSLRCQKFEIDAKDIETNAVIGRGYYGTVSAGRYTPPDGDGSSIPIAIKMARADCPSSEFQQLLAELKILKYIQIQGGHRHIVQFIGSGTNQLSGHKNLSSIFLVFEMCALGNLEQILRAGKYVDTSGAKGADAAMAAYSRPDSFNEVNQRDLLSWTHQISLAMDFIHSKNVIHGDLAVRNVLLDGRRVAKLSDFGLAKQLQAPEQRIYILAEMVPWRWAAIEILESFSGPFTKKSDVWSFGVAMWELYASAETPYSGILEPGELLQTLRNGERLSKPKYATNEMYQTILECWNADPSQRPSFAHLKVRLQELVALF